MSTKAIVQHLPTSYMTLDVWNETPDELIEALKELKTKYPYVTVNEAGEEVTITHCLLNLDKDWDDDDHSVYIREYREETEKEYVLRLAVETERKADHERWMKKQYEELHKKFGV